MIYLTEGDVGRLVSMPRAIECLRRAFRELKAGRADNVPRVRAQGDGIVLHSMSAAAAYLDLVGWKQYTTTRAGARFLVGLHRQTTGELIALVEADKLGQTRTGATTGLAVSVMAPKARRLGLFGSGWQAESQLEAVFAACPLEEAKVYSRDRQRLDDFCSRMSARLGLAVTPADSAEQAVREMPLVVTATTAREPVFEGAWLRPDALVAAVGSNWLQKAEIDDATIERASLVVCDSVAACQAEAGDFVSAIESGKFRWDDAVNLADIVSDPTPKAATDAKIRVFKSVGMALEDVALGAEILEAYAKELAT